MSEKLNDVKKLLTEYINKHNGTLYVYESLLVCFCQPYMIIYEDDKRDGTHNCSIQIDGNLIVSMAYDLDGINVDFEKVKSDAGPHFVQFLRELSIETRKRGVVLSVDNFVPTEYTAHYNRKEQGLVVDYVVIMGYDEYYAGGGQAGPTASISYVENGIAKTKEYVPAEKIINAIPFYTRVWESTSDGLKASTLTMGAQVQWVADSGVEPVWLDEYCQKADFVFNLAGVNRPKNQEEFMTGNFGFASTLLDTLKKYNNTCN